MIAFGVVRPGIVLYIPFESYGNSAESVTMTGFAVGDIKIYKDGGTTERASTNGFTLLDTDGTDFDSLTGIHGFSVDLADNSTAGFYAAGSRYFVVVSSVTVAGQTVSFIAATFTIGYAGAVLDTTIATLASQTSFTLTSGPAEDDALNGCDILFHDVASAVQIARGVILDYTGSTKTVTMLAAPGFTVAATDNVSIFPTGNVNRLLGGDTAGTALKNMAMAAKTGTVATDGTNSATTFKTDLTETATDYYGDANGGNVLAWISGTTNEFQTRRISAYNGTTKRVTVETAFDATPADGDTFILLGRIEIF